MSEPSEAAYEAAARASILAQIPSITVERADGVLAGEFTRDIWLSDELRAAVDAVWPLAEAEGRRQAEVEGNGQCGDVAPDLVLGMSSGATCTLRAGHLGWHEDGGMRSKWTPRPSVTFVHPCGYSQVSPIPHLCPQCGTAEPWS